MVAGISWIWSLGSVVRRKLNWVWKPKRLPCRVISIGNLQAGGSGKTPLVAFLAQEAEKKGLKVAILLRGYRGKKEKIGGVLSPLGSVSETSLSHLTCQDEERDYGDEALLLRFLCPFAWIGVGQDRLATFQLIQDHAQVDVVLLDDGFQNHQIKKDLEIVVLSSHTSSSRVFRDFVSQLKKADIAVWMKGKTPPNLGRFPSSRLIRMYYELPNPPSYPLYLVTGVGDPKSVRESLSDKGYSIYRHKEFPDHYQYSRAQVRSLLNEAREGKAVTALTGKDWVKWKNFGVTPEEAHVIEPKVAFATEEDKKLWMKVVWGES